MNFFNEVVVPEATIAVCSSVVGVTFAYAVLSKLRDFRQFLIAFGKFPWIPGKFSGWIGGLVITAEFGIAISQFTKIGLSISTPIACGLLVTFLLFTIALLKREERPPCLCFGVDHEESIGAGTIVRLSALVTAEFTILILLWPAQTMVHRDAATIVSSLPLALIVITLFVWLMAMPEIVLVGRKFLSVRSDFIRIKRGRLEPVATTQ